LEEAADTAARKDAVLKKYVEAWVATNGSARAIQSLSIEADDAAVAVERRVRNRKLMALLFDSQSDPESAARSLRQALQLVPSDSRLLQDYADFLAVSGESEKAVVQYRKLIVQQPQLETRTRLRIVRLLMQRRSTRVSTRRQVNPAAVSEFKLLLASPPTSPAELVELSSLANELYLAKDAVQLLRKAVRANPGDVDIRMQLANSLASSRSDGEAMEHYRHCLSLTDDIKGKLEIVNGMASVAVAGRFSRQFIDEMQSLPMSAREHGLLMSEALLTVGRSADATSVLEGLLQQDSRDVVVMNRLADVWSSRKLWKQAVRQREMVAKLTNDPEILNQLALDYERAGNFKQLTVVLQRLVTEYGQGDQVASRLEATLRSGNHALACDIGGVLKDDALASDDTDLVFRIAQAFMSHEDKRGEAFELFQRIATACESAPEPIATAAAPVSRSPRRMSRGVQLDSVRHFSNTSSAIFEDFHKVDVLIGAFSQHMTRRTVSRAVSSTQWVRAGQVGSTTYLGRTASVLNAIAAPENPFDMWQRSVIAMAVLDRSKAVGWLGERGQTNDRYSRMHFLVATHGKAPDPTVIAERVKRHPDDELARLALFTTRMPRQQDDGKVDLIRDSYAWLKANRPEVASNLMMNYAVQMDALHDSTEAARMISQAASTADTLSDWDSVLSLLQNFTDVELHAGVLKSIDQYAARQTTPTVEIYSLLLSQLQDSTIRDNPKELAQHVLPLFGYCFERSNNSVLPNSVRMATSRSVQAEITTLTAKGAALDSRIKGEKDASKKAALAAEMQKVTSRLQYLVATQSGASRNQVVSAASFPSECSLISKGELNWMQQTVPILDSNQWQLELNRWIDEKAQAVEPKLGDKYRLLGIYSNWWFGKRAKAVNDLDAFVENRTDDIRLLQSEAFHANGQTVQALQSMGWMQDENVSEGLRKRAVARRQQVLADVCARTDYKLMADCLELELGSFTQPSLDSFFLRRGTPRTQVLQATASPMFAGPMVQLLDYLTAGAKQGNEAQILHMEKVATKRLQEYPKDPQLAALTALLRERLGRPKDGLEPLQIWSKYRLPGEKLTTPTVRDPKTGRMLAVAFARHTETRNAALQIVAERLIADAASGSVQMRVMLADITRRTSDSTSSGASKPDDIQREFDPAIIDAFMQVLYKQISQQPQFERLVAARRMMQCMPTPMVPSATRMMTRLLAEKKDEWEDSNNIIRSVHEAIERAQSELTPDERVDLLAAVRQMVFANGEDQLPQPLAWRDQVGSRVRRGAIADMLIRSADISGQLPQLRQFFEEHPLADEPTMQLLRLEAASVADDTVLADELISQFRSLPEGVQKSVKPWSNTLRAPLEPDEWVLEWVLQRAGRVYIGDGKRILADRIPPDDTYNVTAIFLAGTGFPSEFVADIQGEAKSINRFLRTSSQLQELHSLQLNYLPVTDRSIRHLVACKKLTDLTIESGKLTDAAVETLQELKQLERLALRGTDLSDEAIEKIRKALPDCSVEVD
ncbi:hypothetical protein OAH18_02680, partial [bacterium]|nr:hypothetical protein [bacterium]